MTRLVHFVGSLPAALTTDDSDVLEWFVRRSRGHRLTGVPRDLDPTWVVEYLRARDEHDDVFEVVRRGDFADYADMRVYGLRRGAVLEPRHVAMDRADRIGAAVTAFRALRDRHPELADTRLQISQPNPLDLALFVFGGAAVADGLPLGRALRHFPAVTPALRNLPVFVEAVLAEMAQVVADHGDVITWQVESPIAQLALVKAARLGVRAPVGVLVARQLAGFLARAHGIGAQTVLHLCYGDYQHKELLAPRNLAPAVELLNAVARNLRALGVPLPPAHIPCAYGAHPAPLDPSFYRPLRRLHPDWRVIAGVVSPAGARDSIRSLALFEAAAGRAAYAVATACGLGRCTVEEAERAAAATVATAEGAPSEVAGA
ncbi:hypothetical protein [Nocardia sp. CY41]|uniref:hypothetical protein n=1 Tax=Nocardia sp. CY41 TaxID=2608686 RepID=UPI00135B501D|nr:hypothetical protein [Nocardia sp. CY41]